MNLKFVWCASNVAKFIRHLGTHLFRKTDQFGIQRHKGKVSRDVRYQTFCDMMHISRLG